MKDHITMQIATQYLSALINDDWSGLEDDEVLQLKHFLDQHPDIWWLTADGEQEFNRCAVSGLMADVMTAIGEYK